MFPLTVFALLLSLPSLIHAQQYELIQTYTSENFFEEFNFFSDQDPTGGFVNYVPYDTAATTGLIGNNSGLIYLGVDHTNIYPPVGPGRPSVRLESKLTFTEGLFVLDLTHIPSGCGTWPAFWTVGLGDWPTDGEIDIIENVNDATNNNVALHAIGECSVSDAADQTGTWKSTDCNIVHAENQGCGSKITEPYNYGENFNRNGGGVYAMEWTSLVINIWFFPSTAVPESLLSSLPSYSHPDPSTFGRPSASFAGPCSGAFSDKFFNHTIVIGTSFCGGWAGGSYAEGDETQCPKTEGVSALDNCVNFVGSNPQAFKEAYWSLNSLKVWQKAPGFETSYYENQSPPTIEEPPVANPVKVSSLTGGVLTTEEDLKKPDAVPIDPGIGDDTFSPALESPLGAWNTEGKIEEFPLALSFPNPKVPGVEAAGPTEGVTPTFHTTTDTISSTTAEKAQELPPVHPWSVLNDEAQSQLLILASALGAGVSSVIPASVTTVPFSAPISAIDSEDANHAASSIFGVLDGQEPKVAASAETKRQYSPENFTDYIKDFIQQYQLLAQGFLDLPNDQKTQLIELFTNGRLDAKAILKLKTYDDRIENFIIQYNTFGQFFQTLDEEEKKQLIAALVADSPPLRIRSRQVGKSALHNVTEHKKISQDEDDPEFPNIVQILGDAGTLDPFGMLDLEHKGTASGALNEVEEAPSDEDEDVTGVLDDDSIDDIKGVEYKILDPFGMLGLDDENVDDLEVSDLDGKIRKNSQHAHRLLEEPVDESSHPASYPFEPLHGVYTEDPTPDLADEYFEGAKKNLEHADENAETIEDLYTNSFEIVGKKFLDAM